MKIRFIWTISAFTFLFSCQANKSENEAESAISIYLTTPDKASLISKQDSVLHFTAGISDLPTISVDDSHTYQTIDGFGYTLTGGSATLINQMPLGEKQNLLEELFTTKGNGIGVSYLRISIGASDLSDHVFSYNDLPAGETDPTMEHFSIKEERKDLIPVLKEILAMAPEIKILSSPWSPPVWMKTNGQSKGGSLKPEFYDAYALYFVKYIQTMAEEGIMIDAITIQNEPLHPGNNPSLLMLPEEQAAFIKKSLGPAFERAGLTTKIILYDHNADRPDYPISIMDDPEAKKYVDGSAFHLYGGRIEALDSVHRAHPDKNLYFTEQWVGAPGNFAGDFGWHINNLIIGGTRNWCKTVLEWNLAADENQDPHTDGGCTECLGAVTIAGGQVTARNPAYYVIAQASKFVRPGAVRIASNVPEGLSNVAFHSVDGSTILLVQNTTSKQQAFNISFQGKTANTSLPAGAVATFIW